MNMYLCTTRIKSEYYALLQTNANDRSHHRHHHIIIISAPSSSKWGVYVSVKGREGNQLTFIPLTWASISKHTSHPSSATAQHRRRTIIRTYHPQHPRHDPPSSTSHHPTSYNKIMNYKYNNFSNNKHSSGIQSNNGKERRRNDV